ncbi:MAG: class I SAM-dependent methyltransferase [Scytolyngbya sp. HA4215-MV1]|jgi:2-polyprenyl-3-methyl-5-hydroxy-6-metoxy-1,4-benzoquinol methylase|nr:class I SAM-dependent methyltransferase [Scytolyngbya sp. HA4215-MV1]
MTQHTRPAYEYAYVNADEIHHHRYLMVPLLKILNSVQSQHSTKLKILDLGCGNGYLSNWLAQQGHQVVGVESSASGVTFACENFPNCHFIQASIYDLPLPELGDQFDVVLSAEVIEHLLYPKELVRAAKKCLKPNGRLIITTPYHGYIKNLVLALLGKMDQHLNPLWDGGHIKFFSVATLQELLISEGYRDLKFSFSGRSPYLWKTMLCSSCSQCN